MPQRRALITGIIGQDGSYLAELLLSVDLPVDPTPNAFSWTDDGHQAVRLLPRPSTCCKLNALAPLF